MKAIKNRANQLSASSRGDLASRLQRRKRKAARSRAENANLKASAIWVRFESPTHPGYRCLISPRQLQAFGPPTDPWGSKMRPADGVAPRRLDTVVPKRGRPGAGESRVTH